MARRPLPTTLPTAQAQLIEAKERILQLRTDYANRHQRVLDRQTALRVVLNATLARIGTAEDLALVNAAFNSCTAEMQAVEDTAPDLPIDEFPDRDLPARPGAAPEADPI